ncbi:AP-3 complex subunit sigma [Cercospora beticola]|uniref:AP-3 complex subunit sigma n=1 Tax=Cercospora beticola TaxID=122368 RepID=A0A2G5I901_CERBT|nr:AP-3 complex subunit sigma [Cercospora beticola]PIB00953.1 AP-3 complex subunit sigma [Cercospora beticola]
MRDQQELQLVCGLGDETTRHEELLLGPKNDWESDWAGVKRIFSRSAATVYGETVVGFSTETTATTSHEQWPHSRADTLTSHSATINAASGAQYGQNSIQWQPSGFESSTGLCLITMGQEAAGDSFVRAPRHDGLQEDIT